MSGNRRSARLKRRSRRPSEELRNFGRLVKADDGKFHRERGRCGNDRICNRRDGGTDRTEIVRLALVAMTLRSIAMRERGSDQRDQAALGVLAVDCVNVTKRQGKIDDEREQRKP